MAMHVTGPIISSAGNYLTVPFPKARGTHASASGTVIPEWQSMMPPFTTELEHLALTFAGATAGPQGGSFIVKVWSNGARKGLITLSVAGGTQRTLMSSNLTFTLPASAVARLTVHTVGGTAAGGGGQPTLYVRRTA